MGIYRNGNFDGISWGEVGIQPEDQRMMSIVMVIVVVTAH